MAPRCNARPLEVLDAVHSGQPEVGCHERHVVASVSQPRERVEPGLGRVGRQHPVVGSEAPEQSRLGRDSVLLIGIHDEQHGEAERGLVGGFVVLLFHLSLPASIWRSAGLKNIPTVTAT